MKRALLLLAAVLVLGTAETARANDLELRGGAFVPRANTGAGNDLFRDDSALYTVSKSDWTGFTGGLQYNMKVAHNFLIGISADWYGQSIDTSYRDYHDNGRPIFQTLKVDIAPVGLELRFQPTSRKAKFAPYIGAGGDLFYWSYEEHGDFVRFDDPRLPIIHDHFYSDGWTGGFHVAGGLRFAISDDIGLFAGARYQWAKDDMEGDFRGLKIDLTGASYTGGLSIRF